MSLPQARNARRIRCTSLPRSSSSPWIFRCNMKRPDGQTVFLGSAILIGLLVVVAMMLFSPGRNGQAEGVARGGSKLTLSDIPFDGQRSYQMLNRICDLGSRVSGSPGMLKQQELLRDHFQEQGGQVEFQRFSVRHPIDGSAVPMANLIVRWHPERKERILLCAHYDTRPYPDRDPDPRKQRRLSAPTTEPAVWPCWRSWARGCPNYNRSTVSTSCCSTARS